MPVSLSKLRAIGAVSALGLLLAGCASGVSLPTFGSKAEKTSSANGVEMTQAEAANAGAIVDDTTRMMLSNPKKFAGYCPSVSILGDTNVVQRFDKRGVGSKDQNLIYQGVINQTARECAMLGAEMFIKVGVAGRVLGGPRSTQKTVAELPLRIVVRQQDNILYSKLHKIKVSLNTPDRSALFAKVDSGIAIVTPSERNVQVLVGFDSQSK
ncbi:MULTISPECIES: hypothetical protein [Cohaesibacter]|uniref:hypothetical protein n=1 Tax=Cohaesibacter TaxID=655352 RepID=UPI000DEAC5BB|nr:MULTISPECIES: hypothetical protein [Cohaesibacter]TLP45673.1 hypothetical protein FDK21_13115 [Cohaesibacter sp. CAU 1516]